LMSSVSFGLGVIRGLINDVRRGNAACKHLTLVWTVRHRGEPSLATP